MAPCGTRTRYAAGCRCEACAEANRQYGREHRFPTGREELPVKQMPPMGSWVEAAACRGSEPELFHPDRGASTASAKAVCAGCPVIDECLAWALDTTQKYGVWGGTSEKERRIMRRVAAEPAQMSGPKVCDCCGDTYRAGRRDQRYCSADCRVFDRRRRQTRREEAS